MAVCGCNTDVPCAYGNACGVTTKPGGIVFIGFIRCDYEFTDITDNCEWETAILNRDAVWSNMLVGEKRKATFVKKETHCGPEQVMGGEKSIEFKDYNTGTITTVYDFWNTILDNPEAYRLVFLTCDGWLYGPIDDFTIEVDEIIEAGSKGVRYIEGTIFWNSTI